jgi:hypothetical protein
MQHPPSQCCVQCASRIYVIPLTPVSLTVTMYSSIYYPCMWKRYTFTCVHRSPWILCRGTMSRQAKSQDSKLCDPLPDTFRAPRHRPIFMTIHFPNSLFSQLFITSSIRSTRRAIDKPKSRGCSRASRVTSQPNSSPHALNFTLESLLASQVLAVNNTNQPTTSHFSSTQFHPSHNFLHRTLSLY